MTDQPTSGPDRTTVPGITLTGVLGRGGFATVHRGRDEALRRDVAVKIDSRVITDERDRRRFLREATATTRIADHPHVITVFSAGVTADSRPYLVMELCEGGSMADRLRAAGPLPPSEVLDIGIAVSSALASAHDAGILHRDLKPGNILIDRYGTPRLTDFGLASLTTDGDLSVTLEALTPAYAPPEVLRQQQPTTASDVWSLGATLTAMLTGHHPRVDQSGRSLSLTSLVTAPDTPLTPVRVPGAEGLVAVLRWATHPDPAQRPPTGADLHRALLGVRRDGLGTVPVMAPSPGLATTRVLPASRPLAVAAPGAAVPLAAPPVAAAPVAAARSRAGWLIVPLVLLLGLGGWWLTTQLDNPSAGAPPTSAPTSAPGTTQPSSAEPATSAPATSAPATSAPATASSPPTTSPPASSAPPTSSAAAPVPAVGDCWVSGDNDSLTIVDCMTPHQMETYATGQLDPSSTKPDAYDKDPVVKETCTRQALEGYVGNPKGDYSVGVIGPTQAQLENGARWFACVVAPKGADTSTGSVKQS